MRLVLLDDQPLDARRYGGRHDVAVTDDAFANRARDGRPVARRKVLDVHQRRPARQTNEQLGRIDARPPHPAEVELEEQRLLGQSIEERAAVVERTQLAVVVVEAEVEASRTRRVGDPAEPLGRRIGFGGCCRRLDPRENGALRAKDLGLSDEPRQLVLDRVQRNMPTAEFEPVLVEPRANLLGGVNEEAVQLGTVVAQLGDRAHRPLEVALAVLANGVELKRDACHGEIRNRSSDVSPGVYRRCVGSTGVAAGVAFVAGLGGAVQIAVQGRLSERVGSLEALACAVVVAATTALVVLLVARRSLDGLRAGLTGPKWLLLGGLMSALIVLSITIAGPRIGVVATTAVLIAAQFGLATLIDRFGWFGVEAVPVSLTRIAGLVLLAAGAALTLKR